MDSVELERVAQGQLEELDVIEEELDQAQLVENTANANSSEGDKHVQPTAPSASSGLKKKARSKPLVSLYLVQFLVAFLVSSILSTLLALISIPTAVDDGKIYIDLKT